MAGEDGDYSSGRARTVSSTSTSEYTSTSAPAPIGTSTIVAASTRNYQQQQPQHQQQPTLAASGSALTSSSAPAPLPSTSSSPAFHGRAPSGSSLFSASTSRPRAASPPMMFYGGATSVSSSQGSPVAGPSSSSAAGGPIGAASSTSSSSAIPGRRAVQSCAECKRRKIKCNREYPCGPCIMRGDAASCERPDTTLGTPLFDSLAGRLLTLEDTVRSLQRKVAQLEGAEPPGASAETSPASVSNGSTVRQRPGISLAPLQVPKSLSTPSVRSASIPKNDAVNARGERGQPPEEEVALMLEDIAMSFNANKSRVRQSINPHHEDGLASRPPTAARPDRARMMNPLSVLGPQRSWMLVETYFRRIEWYTKSLHAPSFIAECEAILRLDPEEAFRTTRTSFFCCLTMVLCCSLHLLETNEAQALGYTMDESSRLAEEAYHCGMSMLCNSDWLSAPSLEYLQSIVVAGVFMYNTSDEADVHWALLGSAIKTAQNLGLSRLGCEAEDKEWPPAWKTFRRRETGRRVWWNLVMLDWSHAQAHNGTYCVHPSQNHTAPPSNVDDVDMNDHYVSRPLSQYTESTMNIFKLRFVTLYREFVDHLNANQPADYSFIVEMDGRICEVISNFPEYFSNLSHPWHRDPRRPNLEKEALLIQITAANRHLRLHRPYLMRGYHEEKFRASKDRCVGSARSVLGLLRLAGERCPEIFRLWIVLFYSFVASIVCFIELTNNPSHDLRATLRDSVELLKLGSSISAAARTGVRLLEGLLAAEQEITSSSAAAAANGPPGKRPRLETDEANDSPFRKVVNRLLLSTSSDAPASCHTLNSAQNTGQVANGHQPSGVMHWNLESSIAAALTYGDGTQALTSTQAFGMPSAAYATGEGEYGHYAWHQGPPRAEGPLANAYAGEMNMPDFGLNYNDWPAGH